MNLIKYKILVSLALVIISCSNDNESQIDQNSQNNVSEQTFNSQDVLDNLYGFYQTEQYNSWMEFEIIEPNIFKMGSSGISHTIEVVSNDEVKIIQNPEYNFLPALYIKIIIEENRLKLYYWDSLEHNYQTFNYYYYKKSNEISISTQRDLTTIIKDVYNPITGKTWMDRNLGASRVATSITDIEAFGDYYQWGRGADGHEKITSNLNETLSINNIVNHSDFITPSISPYDWRNPQNNNLWQGENGSNNPCPNGYRLPTKNEWEAEINSWNSKDEQGAIESVLALPTPGRRYFKNGTLSNGGCVYWSSSVYGEMAWCLSFGSSYLNIDGGLRGLGGCVRCIKD